MKKAGAGGSTSPGTGPNPTVKGRGSTVPMPPDTEVNQMYRAMLVETLTPPTVRERLIATQTLEQKWRFVQLHKTHADNTPKVWGDKETALLRTIEASKSPDIQSLLNLKVFLTSASKEFMVGFLENGGVAVLTRVILQRVNSRNFGVIDAAILYETLLCYKLIMNNSVGMRGVLDSEGSMDAIALCLKFDYKHLSLLVLEILAVTCFSELATKVVVKAMKVLARKSYKPLFASLAEALVEEDIEIRCSVMELIHNMLLHSDPDDHALLRQEFENLFLDEKVHESTAQVDRELEYLEVSSPTRDTVDFRRSLAASFSQQGLKAQDVSADKLRRGNLVALKNLKPSNQTSQQTEDMVVESLHNTKGDAKDGQAQAKTGGIHRNHASFSLGSATEFRHSGFVIHPRLKKTMFGATKVKGDKSWCTLEPELFTCFEGEQADRQHIRFSIPVSSIVDVRMVTSNEHLLKLAAKKAFFILEIVTAQQAYGLGVTQVEERDEWLRRLSLCRDQIVISRSSYYMQRTFVDLNDALKFSRRLKKLCAEYQQFLEEEREIAKNEFLGVAENDLNGLFSFLQKEMLAAGKVDQLLPVIQEMLVLPPGSEGVWEAVLKTLRHLRRVTEKNLGSYDEWLEANTFSDLVARKADAEGGAYKQMAKLAQAAIASEQEAKNLRLQLVALQEEQSLLAVGGGPLRRLSDRDDVYESAGGDEINNNGQVQIVPATLKDGRFNGTELHDLHGLIEDLKVDKSVTAVEYEQVTAILDQAEKDMAQLVAHKDRVDAELLEQKQQLARVEQELQSLQKELQARPAAASSAAASANARYEKYEKMKKMLPEGAVRQKMTVDGFTEQEIEDFFAGKIPASATSAPASSVATSEVPVVDARYEKYEKMKKMLPEGAVRQKMTVDGFTEQEIEDFFAGKVPTSAPSTGLAAETGGASVAPAADARYEKYEKMKKMLPEGAVRQKMMTDGFSPQEIDDFMAGKPPSAAAAPAAVAAPATDSRYEKYEKMKKMLPEGAVRQKMMTDGFSPQEIDDFMAGKPPSAASATTTSTPAVDPRFEKYEKMRKMLPEGAVRQKMMTDGLSEQEINTFFGVAGGSTSAPAAKPAIIVKKAAAPAAGAGTNLEKYEKMRKMLPEGAVRQKMVTDGVPQTDIDAFFGTTSGSKPAAAGPPKSRTKSVYWTKLGEKDVQDTIWKSLPPVQLDATQEKLIEEWFSSKPTLPPPKAIGAGKGKNGGDSNNKTAEKPPAVSVVDSKRAQNIMIVLGKLRKDPQEIKQMILDLDPRVLTQEVTANLQTILPTAEEEAALKEHKDPTQMDQSTRLFYYLLEIPRLHQRIDCHEVAFTWGHNAQLVANQLHVLSTACDELTACQVPLATMLSYVLSIGNFMNGGTKFGEAQGVKLETLLKLSTVKGIDAAHASMLHFLALMASQQRPEALQFADNWKALWAAADISVKQVLADLTQLEAHVNKLNSEFTRIKDGTAHTDKGIPIPAAVLAAVSNDSIDTTNGNDPTTRGNMANGYYRRLYDFLHEAKPVLAKVKAQAKAMESAVETVMHTYGESAKANAAGGSASADGEDPCKRFFSTLAEFAHQLQAAHEANERRRKAEERAKRAAEDAAAKLEARMRKQQQLQQQQLTRLGEQKDQDNNSSLTNSGSTTPLFPPAASHSQKLQVHTTSGSQGGPKGSPLNRQHSSSGKQQQGRSQMDDQRGEDEEKGAEDAENIFGRFHEQREDETHDARVQFRQKLQKSVRLAPLHVLFPQASTSGSGYASPRNNHSNSNNAMGGSPMRVASLKAAATH